MKKPKIAQIIGAGYVNKGAMLMLLAINQRLRERGIVVTVSDTQYARNSLIYGIVPHSEKTIGIQDIDFIFDASGFCYSDQWCPPFMNIEQTLYSYRDIYYRRAKEFGAKVF